MITKFYIVLRIILRKVIFLFIPRNSKLINYFVNLDIFLRKKGILEKKLNGKFNFMNCKFYYDKLRDTSIASSILTNGNYEKETFNEIRNSLFNGDVFIDGGANIGFYSILSSKFVGPKGKVISFEPTSTCYNYLLKNIKINKKKNIFPIKKAISNKNSTVFFNISENSEENSIVKNSNKKDNIVKIKATSIDSYCKNKKIKKVDLIKLDIEGQELQALKGSRETIIKNKNIKIIFELNIANRRDGIIYSKKIFNYLSKLNFKYFKLLLDSPIIISNLKNKKNTKMLKKITERYNVNVLAYK